MKQEILDDEPRNEHTIRKDYVPFGPDESDCAFVLALLDAERAKSADLQVKLDAAIVEGCEHAADLSACRLANKLLAETFARETEQYVSRQRIYESHRQVLEMNWAAHQKQFDEQAKEIATLTDERDRMRQERDSGLNADGTGCDHGFAPYTPADWERLRNERDDAIAKLESLASAGGWKRHENGQWQLTGAHL